MGEIPRPRRAVRPSSAAVSASLVASTESPPSRRHRSDIVGSRPSEKPRFTPGTDSSDQPARGNTSASPIHSARKSSPSSTRLRARSKSPAGRYQRPCVAARVWGTSANTSATAPRKLAICGVPKSERTTSSSKASGNMQTARARPSATGTRKTSTPAPAIRSELPASAATARPAATASQPPTAQPRRHRRPVSSGTAAARTRPQPNSPVRSPPIDPVSICAAEGTGDRPTHNPSREAASPLRRISISHGRLSTIAPSEAMTRWRSAVKASRRCPVSAGPSSTRARVGTAISAASGLNAVTNPTNSAVPANSRSAGDGSPERRTKGSNPLWRHIRRRIHGAAAYAMRACRRASPSAFRMIGESE